jgi:hypothetical protein
MRRRRGLHRAKQARPLPRYRRSTASDASHVSQKVVIGKNVKSATKKVKGGDTAKKAEIEEALAFIAPQQVCAGCLLVLSHRNAWQ